MESRRGRVAGNGFASAVSRNRRLQRQAARLCSVCAAALAFVGLVATPVASAAPPATAVQQIPTLFAVVGSAPKSLAQGAQKSFPVKIDESAAMNAVFQGGMWLSNPEGGRIYAKYSRHILHKDGTWTWIGSVDTKYGP